MHRSHLATPRCPPLPLLPAADQERLSEFDLKLMDIDSEHLGIPEAEYDATVKMPAGEVQRIVKDLSSIGDTGGCAAWACGGVNVWGG